MREYYLSTNKRGKEWLSIVAYRPLCSPTNKNENSGQGA